MATAVCRSCGEAGATVMLAVVGRLSKNFQTRLAAAGVVMLVASTIILGVRRRRLLASIGGDGECMRTRLIPPNFGGGNAAR